MGLKNLLEKIEPHFTHGGKLEKYYPLYEAAATIIAPVLIYIIWSRRVQMIKTRKWRESIEKQMKNKDEKES